MKRPGIQPSEFKTTEEVKGISKPEEPSKSAQTVSQQVKTSPQIPSLLRTKLENRRAGRKQDEHFRLKLQEGAGLGQQEFDRLLELDLELHLRNNPPIKEVFDPEEQLSRIRNLPREEKNQALTDFKENLARQRVALATLRVFIERSIEFNNDTPKERIAGLIEKFGANYGFCNKQRQAIEQVISSYYENRRKALEIRQQYPDDRNLVEKLTGVRIENDAELSVSVGPMSIDIYTDGPNARKLYATVGNTTTGITPGGFATAFEGENTIYYTVINMDPNVRVKEYVYDPKGRSTRKHEHEHHKNRLFIQGGVFGFYRDQKWEQDIRGMGYREEQDPEVKSTILETFFKAHREEALEMAKNEITSSMQDRALSILQHSLEEIFFAQDGSPYDYLSDLKEIDDLYETDPLYKETFQRICIQEYRSIIEEAVEAFRELATPGKGKYPTQNAIAVLTDVPLKNWPKAVKRLLEQGKTYEDIL